MNVVALSWHSLQCGPAKICFILYIGAAIAAVAAATTTTTPAAVDTTSISPSDSSNTNGDSKNATTELPKPLLGNGKLEAGFAEASNAPQDVEQVRQRQQRAHSQRPTLMDIALQVSAREGLDAMTELYGKIVPDIIRNGQLLEQNHPAALLSQFSAPVGGSIEQEMAAYATISATKAFKKNYKHFNELARQAHTPRISLRRTALEGLCPPRDPPTCMPASERYRTHDGTCNNKRRPRWGAAQMPFNRFLPPEYGDGVDSIRNSVEGGPLSSSRFVSLLVHGAKDGEAALTLLTAQWGQLLDHDMTSTAQPRSINGSVPSCCGGKDFHPSCFPIKVPLDDPWLAPLKVRCLEFLRSAPAQRRDCILSWREQTNQATSYIDASPIYSNSAKSSDNARVFRNGLLVFGRGNPAEDVCQRGAIATQCIRAGDGRSGEQPGLLALHHVWVGEHNRIAMELSEMNLHWSDEKIYQETRRIIGAMFQHITYREFLPIILGREVCKLFDLDLVSSGYYNGYDVKVNPTVANSFAAAAFRFGHSLVQNSYVRCDRHHNVLSNNVSLHEEFQRGDIGSAGSLHRLLRGMATQRALKRDEFITPELTNHLFQTPGFPFGLDLAAINIQRGRDHGIPPYTAWRVPCGLTPIANWEDFANVVGPESAQRIGHAYRSVHDIDLFVGGIAERPVVGGLVGPTFACILAQQFSNSRKGDRFWYENGGFESAFTPAQLHSLRRVSLAQVMCRAVGGGTFQPHIFIPAEFPGNERLPCGFGPLAPIDLSPWQEQDPFGTPTTPSFAPERVFEIIPTDPHSNAQFIKENKAGFSNRIPAAATTVTPLTLSPHVQLRPNAATGFQRPADTVKINDKLDIRHKVSTTRRPSLAKPVKGVNNKLDKGTKITLNIKNVNLRRVQTTRRTTVVVNNIPLELRSATPEGKTLESTTNRPTKSSKGNQNMDRAEPRIHDDDENDEQSPLKLDNDFELGQNETANITRSESNEGKTNDKDSEPLKVIADIVTPLTDNTTSQSQSTNKKIVGKDELITVRSKNMNKMNGTRKDLKTSNIKAITVRTEMALVRNDEVTSDVSDSSSKHDKNEPNSTTTTRALQLESDDKTLTTALDVNTTQTTDDQAILHDHDEESTITKRDTYTHTEIKHNHEQTTHFSNSSHPTSFNIADIDPLLHSPAYEQKRIQRRKSSNITKTTNTTTNSTTRANKIHTKLNTLKAKTTTTTETISRIAELRQYQTQQTFYTRPQKVVVSGPNADQYEIEINIRQTNKKNPSSIRPVPASYPGEYTTSYKPYGYDRYSPHYAGNFYTSTDSSHGYYQAPPKISSTNGPQGHRTKPPTVIYINEHDDRSTTRPPGPLQNFITFATSGFGVANHFRPNPVSSVQKEKPSYETSVTNIHINSPHSSSLGGATAHYEPRPPSLPISQSILPATSSSSTLSQVGGVVGVSSVHASSSAVSAGNFGSIVGVASANGGDSTFSFNIRPRPSAASQSTVFASRPSEVDSYGLLPPRKPEYVNLPVVTPVSELTYHEIPLKEDAHSPFSTPHKRPQSQLQSSYGYYQRTHNTPLQKATSVDGELVTVNDYEELINSRTLQPITVNGTDGEKDDDDDDDDTINDRTVEYEYDDEHINVGKKFDRDGYLRPEHMTETLFKSKLPTTQNETCKDANATLLDDNYVMPVLNITNTLPILLKQLAASLTTAVDLGNVTEGITNFPDIAGKHVSNEILAEDYEDFTAEPLTTSKTAALTSMKEKRRDGAPIEVEKSVAFAPIKVLTKLERPDHWVIYDTPNEKPMLPELPEITIDQSSPTAEVPTPIQGLANIGLKKPLKKENRESEQDITLTTVTTEDQTTTMTPTTEMTDFQPTTVGTEQNLTVTDDLETTTEH